MFIESMLECFFYQSDVIFFFVSVFWLVVTQALKTRLVVKHLVSRGQLSLSLQLHLYYLFSDLFQITFCCGS